jgi:type II secretory pathway pseudopilin PulG
MPPKPAAGRPSANSSFEIRHSPFASAFTLIEVLVAVTLLSLIVIALMAVFNGTQTAFRAGVTQTDVLESGRAAMDLMAADLRQMSPSLGASNRPSASGSSVVPVNFYANTNVNYSPLVQPLPASSGQRTYVLENFFILSGGNQNGVPTWFGTGYTVYLSPANLFSLYRFSSNCPVAAAGAPTNLFYGFQGFLASPTNYSHLMDGVVGLTVRPFDVNGGRMTNSIVFSGKTTTNQNVFYLLPSNYGETGFYMLSNALPATVEVEMDALEDRTLQRAESLPNNLPAAPPNDRRTIYLESQPGAVHVFRQRVSIPNVDPSAYQ